MTLLGTALSLLFTLGWIPLYLFRVENVPEALRVYTPSERWSVATTVVIISAHATVACIATAYTVVPVWRAVLSVLLCASGIAFWFWARALIGPVRERRDPGAPPLQLRTDGAFGVVRHPLYLACVIVASAPVVAAARPFLVVTLCACVATLALRAMQEERHLHEQLGAAYAAYCTHVQRLIPFIW